MKTFGGVKSSLTRVAIVFAVLFSVPMFVSAARAQGIPMMGPPIPTVLVITKPAPGQVFGNQTVVTMGVGTKKYKFILNDGYVNTTSDRLQFPSIWQYVRMHQPNFIVQGAQADTFDKIEPGQEVTISGMFAPLDRTFEVINVQPGKGPFNPQKSY